MTPAEWAEKAACGACTFHKPCMDARTELFRAAMAQAREEALREAEEEAKDAASRVAAGKTSMAARGCAVAALTAFAAKLHELAIATGTPPAEPGEGAAATPTKERNDG